MKFIDYRSSETGGVGCESICGPTFAEAMFYDNKGNSFSSLCPHSRKNLKLLFPIIPFLTSFTMYSTMSKPYFNEETEKAENLMKSHHFVSTGKYYEEDLMSSFGKEFPDYLKAVKYAVDLFRREYHEEIDYDDIKELS